MKNTQQLLEDFYNKKINISPIFEIDFKDITQFEKNRMEDTFSFQWFVLAYNCKKLIESLKFDPAVFLAYIFAICWFGFFAYLAYVGFMETFVNS